MIKFQLRGSSNNAGILSEIFSQLNRSQKRELRREIRELTGTPQKRYPRLKFLGQAILLVLGFVGGTTFVQIRNAYPNVTSTRLDPKRAFLFPFVVSNDQALVTFYNVTPSFESVAPDLEQTEFVKVWGIKVKGTLAPSVNLGPSDKAPFRLFDYTVAGLRPHLPNNLTVYISVAYELHLFPYTVWHRVRHFQFDMMKGSDGDPLWFPTYVPT